MGRLPTKFPAVLDIAETSAHGVVHKEDMSNLSPGMLAGLPPNPVWPNLCELPEACSAARQGQLCGHGSVGASGKAPGAAKLGRRGWGLEQAPTLPQEARGANQEGRAIGDDAHQMDDP